MNGLEPIALGIGLQDGINPCVFMTCSVFILFGFWLKQRLGWVFWFRLLFCVVYAVGVLAFNFGPPQIVVFNKYFIVASKIIYFCLAIWIFILGILFLKDWFSLKRGLPIEDPNKGVKSFPAVGLVAFLVTIILALGLSALSTFWPINIYFMLLGNEALLKGQLHLVLALLINYILTGMWPLWLVWIFLSIKNLPQSWLKIICACIFFTASTIMIFIFK